MEEDIFSNTHEMIKASQVPDYKTYLIFDFWQASRENRCSWQLPPTLPPSYHDFEWWREGRTALKILKSCRMTGTQVD